MPEIIDIVQVDDPALTYVCDRSLMAGEGTHDERLRREWNPERQIPEAIDAINRVIEGLKAEVHLHAFLLHSASNRARDPPKGGGRAAKARQILKRSDIPD